VLIDVSASQYSLKTRSAPSESSGVQDFEVRLWGAPNEVHLTVSDSGAGFDPEAAMASPGLGLPSMAERVKLLNGTLTIESQPQHGTKIHARVPLSLDIKSTQPGER
jgi:signal transduction histidine kinase